MSSAAANSPAAQTQEQPSTRSYSSNTATVLSAQAGRAMVTLLLEVMYARLLGPAGRGQIGLCTMIMGFGMLVGGLGGEIPVVLWSADPRRKSSDWLVSIGVCGILGSILSVAAWSAMYWLWHPSFLRGITPILALELGAVIPLTVVMSYSLSLALGLDRLAQRSILIVFNQLLNLGIAVFLLGVLVRTAEAAMLAVLLSYLGAAILSYVFLRDCLRQKMSGTGVAGKLREALRLGVRGQLGNLATFFNYRLDVFFVNYYLNTSEVGLYSLGVMISEVLWQVPNAAAITLLSRTARTIDRSQPEFTCLVNRQVFALATVSGLAMSLVSPWLLPLIFGHRFTPSVPVIWWILPGTIAFASSKVISADLLARGWPQYSSNVALLTMLVTVIADWLLIPRLGIEGAAIASSIAYGFNNLLMATILTRKLGVSWKSLYIPTISELGLYRQIWTRLVNWLSPSLAH